MLKPLQVISEEFGLYIQEVALRKRANAHTANLQHWLNEQLGQPQGTIYLQDYVNNLQYLYYREERGEGVYMRFRDEGDGLYLNSSPPVSYGGFSVNIPQKIATEENIKKITQWVDFYKYAGTSYKIIVYE